MICRAFLCPPRLVSLRSLRLGPDTHGTV